ncbi:MULTISPECIES: Na+/H+ antiporter subunit E [unclassified Shinella]|uniref:Na+/H+ antiporter subunit E n=1 Tax=unclassified Shinella TaxID=2643062 RepID=UPI00234E9EFC|nr:MULTISPECIES: Na+/H+ antiporter subunit E [unclassified Shinella]MCO5150390.1 Na+/H+ antiporter subunit E [Shinella sp.]MDC7261337.1 Na+/H+ antiporter subunit E [Shinella sp. HY16]MDC7268232.1 Na+/H+ antiporter subunit E [Shinella sp. YZ44]
MRPAFTIALLALLWLAVSGSFTFPNLLLGLVAGALSLALIRDHIQPDGRRIRPLKLLSLVLLFIKELALSAWKVAVLVASPKMALKPGIFAFPLTVDRDFEITLLANLITLTPGTLSVDVSADRKVLYVHALDCSDPVGTRRDIADGFEKKILEAFR